MGGWDVCVLVHACVSAVYHLRCTINKTYPITHPEQGVRRKAKKKGVGSASNEALFPLKPLMSHKVKHLPPFHCLFPNGKTLSVSQ